MKREAEAPDLWSAISQETALFEASIEPNNSVFPPDQQQLIAGRVDEIEQYLHSIATLNPQQADFAKRRFEYVKQAASRLGQQDWINITISAMFSIGLEAAMPPETVREFFRFAWNLLAAAIGIAIEKLVGLN